MNINKLTRNKGSFPLGGQALEIKQKVLDWASQFSTFCVLDSSGYHLQPAFYDLLAAIGDTKGDVPLQLNNLDDLQRYHDSCNDWLFGHIAYDLKNELHKNALSKHESRLGFENLYFFQPKHVVYIDYQEDTLFIESVFSPGDIWLQILDSSSGIEHSPTINFQMLMGKTEYLNAVERIRDHIKEGDCYEINFCNHHFAENVLINPLCTYKKLNELSPAPFSAFYRTGSRYAMCASPERYLTKIDRKVLSQPIKGTARRGSSPEDDDNIKLGLSTDVKEIAENVMIVDLVRNDLAASCKPGSIAAEELFGIYTYPQVHQMMSTLSGILESDVPFTDAIKHSFPMGSMTGAPKHKVMQLIDEYERTRRELFSGSIGYIAPNGDFDFNVVIRTLFYNSDAQYLSFSAGGAITFDSVPEKEWDEMRLKGAAIERIFS